ncbi:MAG: phosphomethylpyrimidine synthase ThiC, partial [Acidianus sp.]|nr:phosphomethylpyrimidine synthase ThiC [Acidianus sp.]
MVTQITEAKSGNITEEMKIIAKLEGESPEKIRDRVAKGKVVIFKNIVRQNLEKYTAIGEGVWASLNFHEFVSNSQPL